MITIIKPYKSNTQSRISQFTPFRNRSDEIEAIYCNGNLRDCKVEGTFQK